MKNNITKVIFILLMISGLIIVNIWAFRSSIPFTVIPTMLGSILLLPLEEVAEKYANEWEEIYPELDPENMTPIEISKIDFIAGVKWQQERSYSEEEVLRLLISKEENTKDSTKYNGVEYITPEEWLKQFKKK